MPEFKQERHPGEQGWQKVPSKYWLELQKRQVLVAMIRKWLTTQEVQVMTLVEQPEQGMVQLTQMVPLNLWVGEQVMHWLPGVRCVPGTQLLQTVRPVHVMHGETQAEQPTPLKYSFVPQVMQVLEGVRYLPETQEVHSVSLFAQFWQVAEQAVHTGAAGAGGRYSVSGQSLHTLPASTFGKTQARQVSAVNLQSEQGEVQGVQVPGYGLENWPIGQLVHLLPPTSRLDVIQEVQSTALVQFRQGGLQATQSVVPLK